MPWIRLVDASQGESLFFARPQVLSQAPSLPYPAFWGLPRGGDGREKRVQLLRAVAPGVNCELGTQSCFNRVRIQSNCSQKPEALWSILLLLLSTRSSHRVQNSRGFSPTAWPGEVSRENGIPGIHWNGKSVRSRRGKQVREAEWSQDLGWA